MTFVITDRCKEALDRGCVDACPVDCIYEGEGMLHIQPDDCIDCEACMGVCPVQAIFPGDELPAEYADGVQRAKAFFVANPHAKVAKRSFEAE